MEEEKLVAVLYSAFPPDDDRRAKFEKILSERYKKNVELKWEESHAFPEGFKLECGEDVYDWTVEGRLKQLKNAVSGARGFDQVIPLIKKTVHKWHPFSLPEQFGTVLTVGDGIATVSGLENVTYGEILVFENGGKGMVQNLEKDKIGCFLFDEEGVVSGSKVLRTGKTAGIPVGEGYIGRIIDALGEPVDGGGEIECSGYREIEHPAPRIIDRMPINRPMSTGILAIDSMFPIGRGQRELIIGDRQTGKTAIAVDTILNQKGKGVICVYVSIGQKAGSVAQLVERLRRQGAMDYTVVMVATAGETATKQYIAPYSATSVAEYFMEKGKDVLIVYDDLSKHAVSYRSLSLLLGRSPGREAYPGDVFYLHSRLLERSAKLCDRLGGGSLTALPIVETQSGDVSAYVPTNIISITDGQIFLEKSLFFSGQRPAVNIGLSVSRVGGSAQTKAMKKAVGALRLELAQYREIEVFTQFASDLDESTLKRLRYGQTLMQMLRQPQNCPKKLSEEVIMLIVCLNHVADDIALEKVGEFLNAFTADFEVYGSEVISRIDDGGNFTDDDKKFIIDSAERFKQTFK